MRNEPQSEPFVGQARLLLIENIFFGYGCRIRQVGSRWLFASEKSIFKIDFSDKIGFQKQNRLFFGRRYPLPTESDFFNKLVMSF